MEKTIYPHRGRDHFTERTIRHARKHIRTCTTANTKRRRTDWGAHTSYICLFLYMRTLRVRSPGGKSLIDWVFRSKLLCLHIKPALSANTKRIHAHENKKRKKSNTERDEVIETQLHLIHKEAPGTRLPSAQQRTAGGTHRMKGKYCTAMFT